jgi:serine/threonine-protein kinase
MSSPVTTPENHDHLLDEVLADYLRAAQAGTAPSRETLAEKYPMLAAELACFFADQDHVERVAAPLRKILPPRVCLAAGCSLGDYELLEEIAQGGMGVVWKARQKSLGRIVAVKVLRSGPLPTQAEWERFRVEAQAVAALDHPGIVPIYEVGETDGLPFFSMKYVEGGSLARHRSRFQAEPRMAARIVALVARAVQHAHERGVLHRDLKPANVLLASRDDAPLSDWQTIVTDFGLAKRTAAPTTFDESDGTLPTAVHLTHTGTILGTPVYVAPEQVRGKGPTIATDVYGLGVILYELLTGQPPFKGEEVGELLRRVQEEEPPMPRSINRRLDRDLEAVTLTCLRKDPEDRYPTAAAAAADLERYLGGEPVSVRRPSKPRRLWLWCRRQPAIAGLMLFILLLIGTSFVVLLTAWQRAEDALHAQQTERKHAEEQRARAEGNLDAIENLLEEFSSRLTEQDLARAPGLHRARKRLLEAAMRHYEQVLMQRSTDARLRREVADTHYRLGNLTAAIGSRADGLASCRKALAIYEELKAAQPDNVDLRLQVARTAHRVGVLEAELGQGDAAEASFGRARGALEEMCEHPSAGVTARSELARVWHNIGNLHCARGQWRDALGCFRKEQAIYDEALRTGRKSRDARLGVAEAIDSIANVLNNLGQPEEHLRCLERAHKLYEALNRERPEDRVQAHLASTYLRLGGALCGSSQWTAALDVLRPGRDLLTALVQDNPHVLQYKDDLAGVHRQMGHAYRGNQQLKEATDCYVEAIKMDEKLHRADPSSPTYRRGLARGAFDLATVLVRQKRWTEATDYLLQAREHYRALSAAEPRTIDYHHSLAMTLNNIAILKRNSQLNEAVAAAREARDHARTMRTLVPADTHGRDLLSTSCKILADLERRLGHLSESAAASRERRLLYPDDPGNLYYCARELALDAAALAAGGKEITAAEQAQRNDYLDSAVKILGEAIGKGWRDVGKLRQDEGWKGLRQREDFRNLIKILEEREKKQ